MTERNKNQIQEADKITKKAMETALLTYFRQFNAMDKALLLMKAQGMAEAAQSYQRTSA